MQHPPGLASVDPHDASDVDPATRHYVVYVRSDFDSYDQDWVPAATMRVIGDAHQAREFWPAIPEYPEASRVALHPSHSSDRVLLYTLFGMAAQDALDQGIRYWVATMRYSMVMGLLRRGIPVYLLNDGQPIIYESAPHRPSSGEPLYVCQVPLHLVPIAVWGDAPGDLIEGTRLSRFQAMFPEMAAQGYRLAPGEWPLQVLIRDQMKETLLQLVQARIAANAQRLRT